MSTKPQNNSPWVRQTENLMKEACEQVAGLFKESALVTCIVHHRGDNDGTMDMMVTPAPMAQLLAVVLRRMTKEEAEAIVERMAAANWNAEVAEPWNRGQGKWDGLSEVQREHRRARMRVALEAMKP